MDVSISLYDVYKSVRVNTESSVRQHFRMTQLALACVLVGNVCCNTLE